MRKSFFRLMTLVVMGLALWSGSVWAQTPADSIALAKARWHKVGTVKGVRVQTLKIRLFDSDQCLSLATIPTQGSLSIVQLDSAMITSKAARAAGARVALNGSYFNMKTGRPTTGVKVDGRTLAQTSKGELFRCDAAILINGKSTRVVRWDTLQSKAIEDANENMLVSGPLLMLEGKRVEPQGKTSFFGRHPRTVMGLNAEGQVLFLVVDGRSKGNADGMTISELAFIAHQLGMVEAINLDGGGSSTLWTAPFGVINHPTDNQRFDHEGERNVSNLIIWK